MQLIIKRKKKESFWFLIINYFGSIDRTTTHCYPNINYASFSFILKRWNIVFTFGDGIISPPRTVNDECILYFENFIWGEKLRFILKSIFKRF